MRRQGHRGRQGEGYQAKEADIVQMSGKKQGAGALDQRVGFSTRGEIEDGLGGMTESYAEVFNCAAGYFHLRGGETVLAARLEGQHTQVVRVRSFAQSRQVTTEWRIEDKRSGQVFNIRDITLTDDRLYLDFLVQSGVAT
jgi:head-tail adaptor